MSNNSACGDPPGFESIARSIAGASGQYLAAGNGITISNSGSSWQSVKLNLPENEHFQKMIARMADIERRLAIIVPNEDLQARFPALQEAYDHYKLIEKLVNDKIVK